MGRQPDPLTEDVRRMFIDERMGTEAIAAAVNLTEKRVWKIIYRIREKLSRERSVKRASAVNIVAGPPLDPSLIVDREPCFNCGVPRDRHAEHGCKTWKGRP